jgi:Ca2+-binding RTX toxin-like protein
MLARPSKAALLVTALLAVVAGALWGVASAGANHIAGATYNGTLTGAGSFSFMVSGNGSEINYLSNGPIAANGCTYDSNSGSIDVPITNHQFNYSTRSLNFSGTFGGKQSASGTFRLNFGCDTGFLSWNATTTASPPTTKCKGKTATIVARPGLARTLAGTNGKDVIVGSSKKDTINAKGGNDTVCGKGANDTLKGGGGKDKLYGQGGKDNMVGGGGKDTCVGAAGNDSANCEIEKSV